MCSKPSCLGDPWCSEWGCCESDSDENFKEPPNRAKGNGGKLRKAVSKRFVVPSSSVEMETICKCFVPKNTKKATNWSSRVFEEWRAQRNEAVIECQCVRQIDNSELCPSNLLECNWPSAQRTATL